MNDLFGVSTTSIMIVLAGLLALAVITVGAVALGNRTMFRMGVRNLPRRRTQTGLVVAGLTLSTLIITAAFVTGDTIDYSFTKSSYDLLQRSDLALTFDPDRALHKEGGLVRPGDTGTIDEAAVGTLEQRFAGDSRIAGVLPYLYRQAAVSDGRSGKAKAAVQLAGYDPQRLAAVGGLRLVDGGTADLRSAVPDEVFVSAKAASQLDARAGDTLSVAINGTIHQVRVAGVVEDELASGVTGLSYTRVPGGIAIPLATLQSFSGDEGRVSTIHIALSGGVRDTVKAGPALRNEVQAFLTSGGLGAVSSQLSVVALKADAIDTANENGSLFTTFFLVLGLFSMAAGIMLVFMIFVMLAGERRPEMGMARAVGAQRRHLVQSFLSEGMAYSLLAGVAGAALGVLASLGMTVGLLKLTGGDSFSLVSPHVTIKSIVIGYSLGVVVTFITVVFASLRASHVNIVAAIRDLPESNRHESRAKTRWAWVVVGVPALIVPPLGLWFILRKGFGLARAWVLGPMGIILALFLIAMGKSNEQLFFFALGISLIPLCIGGMATSLGAPARAVWTAVGVALAAYWLLPQDQHDQLFGEFDSNIEMFLASGIMIVVSFTLIIVYNARLLTVLFERSQGGLRAYWLPAGLALAAALFAAFGIAYRDDFDGLGQLSFVAAGLAGIGSAGSFVAVRFPQTAPALKMAVAYPLASRSRTGLTIAMFTLIVFSLTVFSILMANFTVLEGGAEARGKLDVIATANTPAGIDALAVASASDPRVAGTGRVTLDSGASQVRSAGQSQWNAYPVLGADDGFFGALAPKLESRATGYVSEQAVLEAVRTTPGLALIDRMPFTDNNDADWSPTGVSIKDHTFAPFAVEVRDSATGKTTTVTVIGILRNGLGARNIGGIYVSQATFVPVFGQPAYQRAFLRLQDANEAGAVATGLEATLGMVGVGAESVQSLLDDQAAEDRTFQRMFQAFMALGLIVGIAGLGVIAYRSVVERRQQIGMLRAIGYQRGTIAMTFLFESSFVALMGIISGIVGGAIMGRNLMTSDSFTDGQAVNFALPWGEIAFIIATAYVFSLVMTWFPSRGAARVPVAEALRYE